MTTIAADPKHLGARIGITSVLHTWGSALTHHPHVHMIVPGGGISIDGTRWVACRPDFILPVAVLSCLFPGLFLAKLLAPHPARRLKIFGVHTRPHNIQTLQSPPDRNRPDRRHLPVEELPDRGAWPLSDHDAVDPRVHPALPDARAALGLPPHPALRTAGQWQPRRQHRAGAPTARRAGPIRTARCLRGPSGRRTPHAATTVPLLRQTHVHHRDLPTRHHAQPSTHAPPPPHH